MRQRSVIFACLLLVVASCSDGGSLDERESTAIDTIFQTGVSFDRDPFVRAETYRVIELLSDPALSEYAHRGIKDPSPMVRLASLRATLATDAADATDAATRVFSRGTPDEKLIVLEAVAEYEEGPSRRELLGRALRSKEAELRRIAFEASFLERVDNAIADENEKLLERTLYPELGRYIDLEGDPALAALAVEKFVEVGQADRMDPLVDTMLDAEEDVDERVLAARVLIDSGAEPARKHFDALIETHESVMADDSLGVPEEVVPDELLRLAVLGSVATGGTTYVKRAQAYSNNAPAAETIEVLDALATNSSDGAALTLKVAMQDARRPVRLRAIELYKDRDDADPEALIAALKDADFETQERIATVLVDRFPDEWIQALRSQLQRTSSLEPTLELLRNFVTDEEKAEVLVEPLEDLIEKIAETEEGRRAALASYFLAITSEDPKAAGEAVARLDAPTRYAYLEYLVNTRPEEHVDTFRRYLYDDLYVMRLMSAAGLWSVLGPETERPQSNDEPAGSTDGESSDGA